MATKLSYLSAPKTNMLLSMVPGGSKIYNTSLTKKKNTIGLLCTALAH
jgi:hypothetical protein